MNDRVRELLLGYLLGALEDSEQEAVEQQLRHDAELRHQLAVVHQSLRPLRADKVEFLPPEGLTERTCDAIFAPVAPPVSAAAPATPPKIRLREPNVVVGRSRGWSWLDMSVAACILVAGFLLLFPAIVNSRFQAQITACQENLRQVGLALVQYSQHHNGYFSPVPAQGRLAVAGVYAPILFDSGYLSEPRLVTCPGTVGTRQSPPTIPTFQQLETVAPGEQLVQFQQSMGGDYGYSLGHMVQGHYEPTRNEGRPQFALMADAPNYGQPQLQSLNHGGRGQNVLFEDGHVLFLPVAKPNAEADDVFLNDTGQVAAGAHENDSVVSASNARPF